MHLGACDLHSQQYYFYALLVFCDYMLGAWEVPVTSGMLSR